MPGHPAETSSEVEVQQLSYCRAIVTGYAAVLGPGQDAEAYTSSSTANDRWNVDVRILWPTVGTSLGISQAVVDPPSG
eukprot:12367307-Heterocapsa_arctica.AAC.1